MKRDRNIDFITVEVDQKRRVRRRVLLVVLAVFLLGAVSFVIILARNDFDFNLFLGTRTKEETEESQTENVDAGPLFNASAEPFTDENAVNILFFCSDDGKLDFCVLTSFSEEENTIRVKPVTMESEYSWKGGTYSMRALYEEGSATAVTAVFQDKGIRISRYADLSENSFKQVMQILGDVDVAVPRDVSYAVDGITYTLNAGVQTMRADALLKYMKHAYEGDERYRAQGEAFASILRTHVTEENLLRGEDYFTSLLNYAETNISVFDYAQQKDAAQRFLQNEPKIEVIS